MLRVGRSRVDTDTALGRVACRRQGATTPSAVVAGTA